MGKLLAADVFDSFLLQEINLVTSVTYNISGRVHRDFFSEGEDVPPEEFIPWPQIRPHIYELIKGKNPPVSFRITLSLGEVGTKSLLQKESPDGANSAFRAFVLNIRFENGNLSLISGTSYDTFVPDKSLDIIWDETVKKFLTAKNIEFTPLQ